MDSCKTCGGTMVGDGYNKVMHCETLEIDGIEPDANPIYCEISLSNMDNHEIDRKIAESLGITNYTGDRISWTQDPNYGA